MLVLVMSRVYGFAENGKLMISVAFSLCWSESLCANGCGCWLPGLFLHLMRRREEIVGSLQPGLSLFGRASWTAVGNAHHGVIVVFVGQCPLAMRRRNAQKQQNT